MGWGKAELINESREALPGSWILIVKSDLSAKLSDITILERWDLREGMHTRTGFLDGPSSVQSRSFQVRVATALFLRPKNMGAWELVKHKNDRHVPAWEGQVAAVCSQ